MYKNSREGRKSVAQTCFSSIIKACEGADTYSWNPSQQCGKTSQILMRLHRGGSYCQVGSTCSWCVHCQSHAG